MKPATEALLELAGLTDGAAVLDLASGPGTQTLLAARRVGPGGRVVANDIAEAMLAYVRDEARADGLDK
jgi:ubiquinone/menaquinone biosynthesis C-methylase UbiE